MEELWRPVIGFEDRYRVSNTGKVYSIFSKRQIKSFVSRIGYHDVYLKVNKKTSIKKLHRLVAEAFLGVSSLEINHKDGNKSNNNVLNLEWVSRSENLKHAFKKNLIAPRLGKDNNKTVLTEEQVLEIRRLRSDGWILSKIADKFEVSIGNIGYIVNRQTWKHI